MPFSHLWSAVEPLCVRVYDLLADLAERTADELQSAARRRDDERWAAAHAQDDERALAERERLRDEGQVTCGLTADPAWPQAVQDALAARIARAEHARRHELADGLQEVASSLLELSQAVQQASDAVRPASALPKVGLDGPHGPASLADQASQWGASHQGELPDGWAWRGGPAWTDDPDVPDGPWRRGATDGPASTDGPDVPDGPSHQDATDGPASRGGQVFPDEQAFLSHLDALGGPASPDDPASPHDPAASHDRASCSPDERGDPDAPASPYDPDVPHGPALSWPRVVLLDALAQHDGPAWQWPDVPSDQAELVDLPVWGERLGDELVAASQSLQGVASRLQGVGRELRCDPDEQRPEPWRADLDELVRGPE